MISNGEMASKPSLEILMQQLLIVVAFDIAAPTLGIWLLNLVVAGVHSTTVRTKFYLPSFEWTIVNTSHEYPILDFLLTTKVNAVIE